MTEPLKKAPLEPATHSGLFFEDDTLPAEARGGRVGQIVYGTWAILPEVLREIEIIYEARIADEPFDKKALEDRLGRPLDNKPRAYDVRFGNAIIPIHGVIAKRANLFMQISGGVSSQLLNRDIDAALEDDAVKNIILDIDSPGGTVDGISEVAANIFGARGIKPIYAVADGTMASAAYWIGSAANEVFVRNETTGLGSIGVVGLHRDVSRAEEKRGIKTTEIFAGKFKRIASQFAPLSSEGRDYLQEQVDYLYSLFVGAVAKQRGFSVDVVLDAMAEGRMFIGEQAISAGLADDFMTVEALIDESIVMPGTEKGRPVAALLTNQRGSKMADETTAKQDKDKDNPFWVDDEPATKESISVAFPQIAAALKNDGAAEERKRIQAVEAQSMPGHETLIDDLKYDGVTTGPDAAVKVLQAEKGKQAQVAKDIKDDAPKALPSTPTDAAGGAGEDDAETATLSPKQVAMKARVIVDAEEAAGRKLSYGDAVKQVTDELEAEANG